MTPVALFSRAPRISALIRACTRVWVIDKTGNTLGLCRQRLHQDQMPGQSCHSGSRPSSTALVEIIATYRPQQAAVEIVFVNVNPQSTLLLGQARGAAISALVTADLPVAEYTALQVKQAVVGHGKAAKEQVQEMVARLLNLPGIPSTDAADALACAIAHAHGGQGMGALATLGKRVRGGRLI